MKKGIIIIFSLILTFSSMFSCFAATYKESLSTPLTIRGYYDNNASVAIIASYAFNIEDPDVAYDDKGEGKTIATWSLTSHVYKSVTLKITAYPMTCLTDSSKSLDYQICFYYKFPTYSEDGIINGNKSGVLKTTSTETNGTSSTLENNSPISFSSQDVKFMFIDGVNPSDNTYPAGDYIATVKIEIVSSN